MSVSVNVDPLRLPSEWSCPPRLTPSVLWTTMVSTVLRMLNVLLSVSALYVRIKVIRIVTSPRGDTSVTPNIEATFVQCVRPPRCIVGSASRPLVRRLKLPRAP